MSQSQIDDARRAQLFETHDLNNNADQPGQAQQERQEDRPENSHQQADNPVIQITQQQDINLGNIDPEVNDPAQDENNPPIEQQRPEPIQNNNPPPNENNHRAEPIQHNNPPPNAPTEQQRPEPVQNNNPSAEQQRPELIENNNPPPNENNHRAEPIQHNNPPPNAPTEQQRPEPVQNNNPSAEQQRPELIENNNPPPNENNHRAEPIQHNNPPPNAPAEQQRPELIQNNNPPAEEQRPELIEDNNLPPNQNNHRAEPIQQNNPPSNATVEQRRLLMLFALVVPIIAILMGGSPIPKLPSNPKPDFELTNPLQIKLVNLYSDFSQMPECVEKNLLRLIFFTSVRTLNETQFLNERDIHLPSDLNLAITEEFQALNNSLKNEELVFDKKQESQLLDIKEKVQNKNWEAASEELETLLREIRPLDTNELYRLITKSHEAASLIEGQEIILFLGLSGSGKSTTIHFFGGSEMREIKEGEIDHIAPIKIKNPELKKVFTSATSTSQTRYITPVQVNLEDIDKQLNGSTILCDSPGFEDTSGPEVDIANGVGIIKALQACKSVKPIIVISSQGFGDKLTRLKDLLKTIAGMISGIKDKGDTFVYFFTKFSEKEKKQINAKLSDLRKTLNLSEKSDTNLVDLLNNIIEKTKTELITINPINDNPGILLKKLQESSAILYPSQVFRYSITHNSELTIKAQAERYQSSIKSGIERFDFLLAKYKLGELRRLYEVLQYDHINATYTHCVNYCTKKLNEGFKAGITSLNKCFVEQNSFNKDDIIQYKEHIKRAHKAGEIINAHLGSKAITANDLIQNVQQETHKMLQSLNNKRLNDTGVSITLNKLKLLSTYFSEVNSSYIEGCKIVKEIITDTISAFKGFVESDQFEKGAHEMKVISQAKSILKDHISSTYLDEKYQELRKFVWNSLNNCTDGPDSVFIKEILESKDVLALKTCISRFEVANKTHALKTHIPTKIMNELHNSLFEKLLGHSKEVDSKMTVYFKKEHENSLNKLERLMEEMTLILTIPSMDSELAQTYYTTLGKLEKVMRDSKAQIENILSLIPQRKNAVIPELEPEPEVTIEEEQEETLAELSYILELTVDEVNESLNNDSEPQVEDLIFEEYKKDSSEEIESAPTIQEPNSNTFQETGENPGIFRYFLGYAHFIFLLIISKALEFLGVFMPYLGYALLILFILWGIGSVLTR